MEYLRKSKLGQWTLCKSQPVKLSQLVHHVLDNPNDHQVKSVLADHYIDRGLHPGTLINHPDVKNEPLQNITPSLEGFGDWQHIHPAVRPLLNHTWNSNNQEQALARHYTMLNHTLRERTPMFLDMFPETREHADRLRKLPPIKSENELDSSVWSILNSVQQATGGLFREPNRDYPGTAAVDRLKDKVGAGAFHTNYDKGSPLSPQEHIRPRNSIAARMRLNDINDMVLYHIASRNQSIQPHIDKINHSTNKMLANMLVND